MFRVCLFKNHHKCYPSVFERRTPQTDFIMNPLDVHVCSLSKKLSCYSVILWQSLPLNPMQNFSKVCLNILVLLHHRDCWLLLSLSHHFKKGHTDILPLRFLEMFLIMDETPQLVLGLAGNTLGKYLMMISIFLSTANHMVLVWIIWMTVTYGRIYLVSLVWQLWVNFPLLLVAGSLFPTWWWRWSWRHPFPLHINLRPHIVYIYFPNFVSASVFTSVHIFFSDFISTSSCAFVYIWLFSVSLSGGMYAS